MTYNWTLFWDRLEPKLSTGLLSACEAVVQDERTYSEEEFSHALIQGLDFQEVWTNEQDLRWGKVKLVTCFATHVLATDVGRLFVQQLMAMAGDFRISNGIEEQKALELRDGCRLLVTDYLAVALNQVDREGERDSLQELLSDLDAMNAHTVSLLQDGANGLTTVFSDGSSLHPLVSFNTLCAGVTDFPHLDVRYTIRTVLHRQVGEIHVTPEGNAAGSDEEITALVNRFQPGVVVISREAEVSHAAFVGPAAGASVGTATGTPNWAAIDSLQFMDNGPSQWTEENAWGDSPSPEEKVQAEERSAFLEGLADSNRRRLSYLSDGGRVQVTSFLSGGHQFLFVGEDDISATGISVQGWFLVTRQGSKLTLQSAGGGDPTAVLQARFLLGDLTDFAVVTGSDVEYSSVADLWNIGRNTEIWDQFVVFGQKHLSGSERECFDALCALRTARSDDDYNIIFKRFVDHSRVPLDRYFEAPTKGESIPYGAKSRKQFVQHHPAAAATPGIGNLMSDEEYKVLVNSRVTNANLRHAVLDHALGGFSEQTWEAFQAARSA
ncbi:hypothetical protein AB0D66_33020 [Streptomyces sp. NPDC048270]|uniref:hypothetical protein n=1 Tax=Streptomyces sp. NPDC048270 TaxID=3154615 RepID=UPI0033CD82D3